jgi:hypothetical protein
VKDDVDHDDDQTEFASSSSVNTEGESGSRIDDGKKCSGKDSKDPPMRDLRGIVMDAVIVGAPLCSTV